MSGVAKRDLGEALLKTSAGMMGAWDGRMKKKWERKEKMVFPPPVQRTPGDYQTSWNCAAEEKGKKIVKLNVCIIILFS